MADMETMDAGTPKQPPDLMDEGSTEGSDTGVVISKPVEADGEDAVSNALGIQFETATPKVRKPLPGDESYKVIPNPAADVVDLSDLRGTRAPTTGVERVDTVQKEETNDDLEALAELVPELRSRNRGASGEGHTMTIEEPIPETTAPVRTRACADDCVDEGVEVEVAEANEVKSPKRTSSPTPMVPGSQYTKVPNPADSKKALAARLEPNDSMQVQQSADEDSVGRRKKPVKPELVASDIAAASKVVMSDGASATSTEPKIKGVGTFDNEDQNLGGFDDVNSENALDSNESDRFGDNIKGVHGGKTGYNYAVMSSNVSLSTATQTHEVRMPMYLPNFKPATGCTNASDFIVRCFVARLRSGITVVKHGRSRWCKSRLRILHIHPDGRSLSWKPAVGEPNSSKRPPKLDLSKCQEVRHAWSPDPLNPKFTGTANLRQRCEAANAHKSFALIFPKRTVDITAVTADQCKVLMEGFSALCFRLQVANLAGRESKKAGDGSGARGAVDDEEAATTASVTLTNNSTQLSPSGSGNVSRAKRTSRR